MGRGETRSALPVSTARGGAEKTGDETDLLLAAVAPIDGAFGSRRRPRPFPVHLLRPTVTRGDTGGQVALTAPTGYEPQSLPSAVPEPEAGAVHRHEEVQVLALARGDDADDLALGIDRRPARDPRIGGRVGLDL